MLATTMAMRMTTIVTMMMATDGNDDNNDVDGD